MNLEPGLLRSLKAFRLLIGFLVVILGCAIVVGIVSAPGQKIDSSPPSVADAGSDRKKDHALSAALSGDLASLSEGDRTSSLDQLEEAFRNDSSSFEEIVIQVATELSSTHPAEGFLFLSRFHGSLALSKAKRNIVIRWSDQGLDSILTSMQDRAGSSLLMPFLVSVGQKEKPELFDHLLERMKGLDQPNERELKVSAAESMVELCQPAKRVVVGTQFAGNADLHPYAAALLVKHARDQPRDAFRLLGSKEFVSLDDEAVGDVLRAVGESHPALAGELIESSELESILQDRESANGSSVGGVDRAINSLLVGMLASEPAKVLIYSEKIVDRSMGEVLRQRATELCNAGIY